MKRLKVCLLFLLFANVLFISNVNADNVIFQNSIKEAFHHSMEIKAEKYRLAAIKNTIGTAYSSKDWSSSFKTNVKSSNKQLDTASSFNQEEIISSTISLSKNIFDGGKEYEATLIANENIKLQDLKLKVVEQSVILKAIKSYLDVYKNQSVLNLRNKSFNRFKEHVEATKLKLAAGTVTPTIVAESSAKLAKAKYDVILAEGNLNNSFSSFKSITKVKNIPINLNLPKINFYVPKTSKEIIKISKINNPSIAISKLTKSIAFKNIDLKKTDNRPSLKLEFELKDSQSSASSSSLDYQSYGTFLTFSSPLFYNNSSKSALQKLDNIALASSMDLKEKYREVELSALSSLQSYKSSVAKTEASESEMKSSLLALDGIRKEAEYGIRTVLDVLDAEVNYLNASVNLITSQSDEIFNLFSIKAIIGNLSIQDIDKNYQNENRILESKLKFNVLDSKSFK
tara:strand:- start:1461 stop:2828 length:1368 start_codon:yes stop_codon:yes gene_type:complete